MHTSFWKQGLVLMIILLFVGAGIIPSTVGIIEKETVCTNKSSDGYIQGLIDNASAGDTIYVPSGTYYENIIINKSISLIGEDKNTTIIDGSESGDVVTVTADEVLIKEFTIQYSGPGNPYWYAGIDIHSHSNSITENIISLNNGDGVKIINSSGNIIENNIISQNGGDGIRLKASRQNVLRNNILCTENVNGISLYYSSSNEIIGNTVTNNYFGMLVWGHDNNVIGNNISMNHFGVLGLCILRIASSWITVSVHQIGMEYILVLKTI